MKKIILSLVMCLPLLVTAQKLSEDFKVSKGEPFKVVDAASKLYVTVDGGFTIAAKMHGELVTLQKFDVNGMKEVARNVYEDFPKYAKVQNLIKVDGKVFFIYEAYNKKAKTFTLFSRQIDVKTCKFNEGIKLLTTSRPVVAPRVLNSVSAYGGLAVGGNKFELTTSFDESKIMVKYRLKPVLRSDKENFDEIGFFVFDNNFEKIWGAEKKMPYVEADMNNLATTVKNNGDAFMLARINKTESFEMMVVTEDGLNNQKLNVKSGLVFDKFDLKQGKNGIIAVGYYANGTEFKVNWTGSASFSKNINGLYVFEIDEEGGVLRENDYPFSIELIKQYKSERQKKKANAKEAKGSAGITDLHVKDVSMDADGSMIVVGEVDYIRNEMYGTQQKPVRHFGNMVVTKIDADGKLVWQKKLPKNQATLAASTNLIKGLGIYSVQGDDAQYILFADNRKNANLTMDKPAAAHKGGLGGYLTAYRVDNVTGEVEKHLIMDLTNIDGIKAYQFQVVRILKTSEGVFVLEVYIKGKQDTMIKMELK